MRSSKFKNNDKGMTLVELLVAIAIFAAAIVPMLFAFVYSTGYNFRSQQTMQSTGIAQAIIEKCKGANIDKDDIIYGFQHPTDNDNSDGNESILFGTTFDISSITTGGTGGSDGGEFWLYGIRANAIPVAGEAVDAGNASRRVYDARIVFSPIAGSTTDVSSIQSMTADSTANFTDWLCNQLYACDTTAYDKTFDKIKDDVIKAANISATPVGASPALGGLDLTPFYSDTDIITKRIVIDRKIILTATDSVVNCKVEYYASYDQNDDGIGDSATFVLKAHDNVSIGSGHYNLSCSGTLDNDYTYSTGTTPIYVADLDPTPADGFDFSTNPASAVFFYYYPGFHSQYISADSASYNDHFVIDNDMTAPINDGNGNAEKGLSFYLFKQYDDSLLNHSGGEDNYKPDIEIKDSSINTYVYNNFLWDAEDGRYLGTESGSYANSVLSNVSIGANCYLMTQKESNPLYTGYSSGIRNSSDFVSYALSDMPVLPYLHHTPTGESTPPMFGSRYSIEVRIYQSGKDTLDSDEIEIVNAEVLNW